MADLVADKVEVVHEGKLWKLNPGGDIKNESHWEEHQMWLSTKGGLFFMNKTSSKPVGRDIGGLRVAVIGADKQPAKANAFTIHVPPKDKAELVTTTLAAGTPAECEAWVTALNKFTEWSCPDNHELFNTSQNQAKAQNRKRLSVLMDGGGIEGLKTGASLGPRAGGAPVPQPEAKAAGGSGTQRKRDSQWLFAEKEHTALILDWDDTIFPTTWVRHDCALDWRLPLPEQKIEKEQKRFVKDILDRLGDKLEVFLDKGCLTTHCVIVTLAQRPWVQLSAKNFMPKLWEIIERHNIPIVYAQEGLAENKRKEYEKSEFMSEDDMCNFWTGVKGDAITRELAKLYSQYEGQSWKNIISIGDSNFERHGTIKAIREYVDANVCVSGSSEGFTNEGTDKEGHFRKVRTKTVKLLDEPTAEELFAEAQLLLEWLPHITTKDGGFDIELADTEDDKKLDDVHAMLTGATGRGFKWQELASI